MMGEDRKIGMHVGSGNCTLAFFRVIGQFASAEVIRLSDGGGNHLQMPALLNFSQEALEPEIGRNAKVKWIKLADQVISPLKLLAEGRTEVVVGKDEILVEKLISRLVFELRDRAGLFGDFAQCSVAYPEYLTAEQLVILKNAIRSEIPELEDRHFVPAGFSVLFDMQLHQARYNLGYHKLDFATPKKVLVIDAGENFTTASLFEVVEVGQELEARYLSKPCSIRVGGRHFDLRFADFLLGKAVEKGNLSQAEVSHELRRQVQTDAEKFKRDLVEKVDAQVISTHLPPGKMNDLAFPVRIFGPSGKKILDQEVTKREYDAAVFPSIASTNAGADCVFQAINRALNLAGLRPGDVEEVVMVGGTARVHILVQVLKHVFGKIPREFVSPELCAVRGASIYHDMVSSPLEMRF